MHNFTLAQIAALTARLDGIDDDQHTAYEKALRNLVQRHFLPPSTQQGRIFLYDRAAAVTIRLAQIAAEFGIPRTTIDTMTRWLSGSGDRRKHVAGGFMGVSRADEAIERVTAGETFAIHIIMRSDRAVIVKADWQAQPHNQKVEDALLLTGRDDQQEIARFSLPASELIAALLPLLKNG